jgi:hypothetical protein
MSSYANWDRQAAVVRALGHADRGRASDADGAIWNFAFGSNVNADKVRSRGMTPTKSLLGQLPGWSLVFNHTGGFGNIEAVDRIRDQKYDMSRLPQPIPQEVHGVLLRLSRREFAALADQEYAYDTVEVAVELYDDGTGQRKIQHALAFKSNPCALTTARTLPSSRYIRLIREGARDAGIDGDYCKWLEAIKSEG